jgi:hypothetical protein
VDPKSTSASPLPNTDFAGCWSAASIKPWKVGVDPNGPVHRWVPKKAGSNSQWSPTIAIVPFAAMEISGSLSPSGRINGVLEKVKLPAIVLTSQENGGRSEVPVVRFHAPRAYLVDEPLRTFPDAPGKELSDGPRRPITSSVLHPGGPERRTKRERQITPLGSEAGGTRHGFIEFAEVSRWPGFVSQRFPGYMVATRPIGRATARDRFPNHNALWLFACLGGLEDRFRRAPPR